MNPLPSDPTPEEEMSALYLMEECIQKLKEMGYSDPADIYDIFESATARVFPV